MHQYEFVLRPLFSHKYQTVIKKKKKVKSWSTCQTQQKRYSIIIWCQVEKIKVDRNGFEWHFILKMFVHKWNKEIK